MSKAPRNAAPIASVERGLRTSYPFACSAQFGVRVCMSVKTDVSAQCFAVSASHDR